VEVRHLQYRYVFTARSDGGEKITARDINMSSAQFCILYLIEVHRGSRRKYFVTQCILLILLMYYVIACSIAIVLRPMHCMNSLIIRAFRTIYGS
jgi:hypothetical protein